MKFFITSFFICTFSLSFGQSPEQIALDFFANNLLNQNIDNHFLSYHDEIRLRYDKRIQKIDSQFHELAKSVISDFNSCKNDPRGSNNDEIEWSFNDWKALEDKINTTVFTIPYQTNENDLILPKQIMFKSKLKFKKRRGGFIRFYLKKFWHLFFKERFNLIVEPHFSFNGHDYVLLRSIKNNYEYGDNFYIQITEKKVTDWCEVSWIR